MNEDERRRIKDILLEDLDENSFGTKLGIRFLKQIRLLKNTESFLKIQELENKGDTNGDDKRVREEIAFYKAKRNNLKLNIEEIEERMETRLEMEEIFEEKQYMIEEEVAEYRWKLISLQDTLMEIKENLNDLIS